MSGIMIERDNVTSYEEAALSREKVGIIANALIDEFVFELTFHNEFENALQRTYLGLNSPHSQQKLLEKPIIFSKGDKSTDFMSVYSVRYSERKSDDREGRGIQHERQMSISMQSEGSSLVDGVFLHAGYLRLGHEVMEVQSGEIIWVRKDWTNQLEEIKYHNTKTAVDLVRKFIEDMR